MRTKNRLFKLGLVMLCAAVLLGPADRLCGADDFYVIGGGSPWKRNGTNIYYKGGNVGIGTDNPQCKLDIVATGNIVPGLQVQSDYGDGATLYSSTTADYAATAVAGYANSPTGNTIGVVGYTHSSDADACGVYGLNDSGGSGTGVYGSGPGYGVQGLSSSATGYGVYGAAYGAGAGVRGSNTSALGYGVYGLNSALSGTAIYGVSGATTGNGKGVYGLASSIDPGAVGVHGIVNGTGVGVLGENIGIGYAVYAIGKMGASGAKTAVVPTSQGKRELYAQESPEVWFEDVGEGQLMGGMAQIDLDPLFLETVTINDQHPMKVFIQLNDDCQGVYVQRQATGFEVVELGRGNSRAHFTYRVMAKRQGFEKARLEVAGDAVTAAALQAPAK